MWITLLKALEGDDTKTWRSGRSSMKQRVSELKRSVSLIALCHVARLDTAAASQPLEDTAAYLDDFIGKQHTKASSRVGLEPLVIGEVLRLLELQPTSQVVAIALSSSDTIAKLGRNEVEEARVALAKAMSLSPLKSADLLTPLKTALGAVARGLERAEEDIAACSSILEECEREAARGKKSGVVLDRDVASAAFNFLASDQVDVLVAGVPPATAQAKQNASGFSLYTAHAAAQKKSKDRKELPVWGGVKRQAKCLWCLYALIVNEARKRAAGPAAGAGVAAATGSVGPAMVGPTVRPAGQ